MDTSVELPARPTSAGEARRFAARVLQQWSVGPEMCDIVVLLVSELVTNAILHAGLEFTLEIERHQPDRIRVKVFDPSPSPVQPRHFTTEAGTGRGFMLIEALSIDWGWEATPDGKLVWFEVGSDS